MYRLTTLLLLGMTVSGCDEMHVNESDGGPFPPLNMIQLKGYERSDWTQTDPTPDRAPDFAGHDRPALGAQVITGARVFHLPYHPHLALNPPRGGLIGWDVFALRMPFCEKWRTVFDTLQSTCISEVLSGCTHEIQHGLAPQLGGVAALPTEQHAPIFILISHQPSRYPPHIVECFEPSDYATYGILPEYKLYDLEVTPALDFEEGSVVTPAEIRRHHATLGDAIRTDGWPSMERFFGRYFFILLDTGLYREHYRAGTNMERFGLDDTHPLIFTLADDIDDDEAAFFSVPAADLERISRLVAAGFIVHAHSLDAAELDAARLAGAHLLTGLELADIAIEGPAACNPVTSPAWVGCQPTDFERPPLQQ